MDFVLLSDDYDILAAKWQRGRGCVKGRSRSPHCSAALEGVIAGMKADLLGFGYTQFLRDADIPGFFEFLRRADNDKTAFVLPTIMLRPEARTPMLQSLVKIDCGPVAIFVGATALIEGEALRDLGYCGLAKNWLVA